MVPLVLVLVPVLVLARVSAAVTRPLLPLLLLPLPSQQLPPLWPPPLRLLLLSPGLLLQRLPPPRRPLQLPQPTLVISKAH